VAAGVSSAGAEAIRQRAADHSQLGTEVIPHLVIIIIIIIIIKFITFMQCI
jgi:hypothetical protein